MTQSCPDALVCTEWLHIHLGQPADREAARGAVKVVDGTYVMPASGRNARAEYQAGHLPGAVFFDIDAIAAPESTLPHMLPTPPAFAAAVGALGLGDQEQVVVYDSHGLMSAARVWWMLRVFGHDRVAVLDGGLPKWRQEGHPLSDAPVTPVPAVFTPRFRPELVRSRDQLRANLEHGAEQVVDARPAARFEGSAADPWPGRRPGHIPGSLNLPYTELLDPVSKTFLPAERLSERIAAAGIDPARPVVTSCGSGVTACALALGLWLAGLRQVAVYDGSWAEWGLAELDLPIATGPAEATAAGRS